MQKQENILLGFNDMLTNTSDAFLISDSKGKILYVNSSIENVTGLKAEIHLGKYIQDLLKEKLITHSATFEAVSQRKAVTREVDTIAGKRLLSTASPVFNTAGRLNRVVCNIKDITSLHNRALSPHTELCIEPYHTSNGAIASEIIRIDAKCELAYAGSSPMRLLVQLALQLGRVDSTVLITGETGVGKELIARLIHKSSRRSKSGTFVKVNCASLSENLFESELFGYMPGSFTGALKTGKMGYFERANGGTLFLDEIAELSLNQQARLLSVLQDKEVFRIGSTRAQPLDLRIVSATNHNLENLVAEGKFRKDLYYRLNVISLKVPPLREREDDIPVLISFFFNKIKKEYNIDKQFSSDVIKFFHSFPWPGNVRELANLVENLLITASLKSIDLSCLPEPYRHHTYPLFSISLDNKSDSLKQKMKEFEKAVIRNVMEQSSTQDEAAKKLGISRASLVRKIK
ncbi:MAG: sigma 54-interacting transcriptional regulator [Bacillota bacterium]